MISRQGCYTIPTFNNQEKEAFQKQCYKSRKCFLPTFSLFPTLFYTFSKTNLEFRDDFILSSANAFNLGKSKILSFGKVITFVCINMSNMVRYYPSTIDLPVNRYHLFKIHPRTSTCHHFSNSCTFWASAIFQHFVTLFPPYFLLHSSFRVSLPKAKVFFSISSF